MNVLDSSGWIEYLIDGTNADFFEVPAVDTENLVTPTICVYEVFKRVLLEFGEESALDTVGVMSRGDVVELDRQTAIDAARLSTELKLSMADSIILATAQAYEATLWTQDAHFRAIEGVRFIEKNP
jgi:toxin FitB